MIKKKKYSLVIWITVGVILFLIASTYLDYKERKDAYESYKSYMAAHMGNSDYPGRVAEMVLSYEFYKYRLNDFEGEAKKNMQSSLETYIAIDILELPDDYSIPEELVDEELVELLEELASEDFLASYEQDMVKDLLNNI